MFTLIILWILWCALHSWLISISVTGWLRQRLGPGFRFYRVLYNLISLVTLVPLVRFSLGVDGPTIFTWQREGVVVRLLLLTLAGALFVAGARHYDLKRLVGLSQIRTGSNHNTLSADGELDRSGIMGVTRHPWYLGTLLLLWSIHGSFNLPELAVSTILSVYLVVGTVLEERKLVLEHGEPYRRYQREVSMIIPFRYLGKMVRAKTGGIKR